MPYKSVDIKIANTKYDKRIKLTEEDKREIIRLREIEGLSQRKLAAMFGVSRRLIQFITDPAKHERNRELKAERGYYYHKERHTEYVRDHRRRKQKLYLEGKISFDKI